MNVKIEYFKGVKRYYIPAIICSITTVVLLAISPLLMKVAVDSVIGGKDIGVDHIFVNKILSGLGESRVANLLYLALATMVVTLIAGGIEYLQSYLLVRSSDTISKGIRDNLFKHLLSLSNREHSKHNTGDLLQRCTSDVEMIAVFFTNHFVKIFRTIFLLAMVLYMMLTLDIKMSAISLFWVPLLLFYCIRFFKRVTKYFGMARKADSKLTTVLQENITGVRVVKAFARQKYEQEKYKRASKEFQKNEFLVVKAFGEFWSVTECFSVLQMGFVIIFGAYFAISGSMEVGMLVAFMSYTGEILWPVKELSMVLGEAGRATVSLNRISEILSDKGEVRCDHKLTPEIKGDIEFRNVSFNYDDKIVLDNISFKLEPGMSLGIIGETGSGKSSLVKLIQRLDENYTGDILLDGINIKDISKGYLRDKVTLILQESHLFNRSILDNLKFAKSGALDLEAIESAEKAAIAESINNFENGYNTMVGEGGVTLSGGQKQRIAIARGLIKRNPVIIFDDSLSAVDTATDREIRSRLKEDNPTSIIVTHRVSTLKECDKILVLEKGRVTAFGNHFEIKELNTLYSRILEIQNEVKENFHLTMEDLAYV